MVHLITEDLDLAVGSMQWFVTAVVVAVGVYLYHQRKTLHPLLRGEICAQTVHRDEDLTIREKKTNENVCLQNKQINYIFYKCLSLPLACCICNVSMFNTLHPNAHM